MEAGTMINISLYYLCLAFLFMGSFAAVFIGQYLWKRLKCAKRSPPQDTEIDDAPQSVDEPQVVENPNHSEKKQSLLTCKICHTEIRNARCKEVEEEDGYWRVCFECWAKMGNIIGLLHFLCQKDDFYGICANCDREREHLPGCDWACCCKLCFSTEGQEHDEWCNKAVLLKLLLEKCYNSNYSNGNPFSVGSVTPSQFSTQARNAIRRSAWLSRAVQPERHQTRSATDPDMHAGVFSDTTSNHEDGEEESSDPDSNPSDTEDSIFSFKNSRLL